MFDLIKGLFSRVSMTPGMRPCILNNFCRWRTEFFGIWSDSLKTFCVLKKCHSNQNKFLVHYVLLNLTITDLVNQLKLLLVATKYFVVRLLVWKIRSFGF